MRLIKEALLLVNIVMVAQQVPEAAVVAL